MFVTVECEGNATRAITEGNVSLLLGGKVCVARRLLERCNRMTKILITHFSNSQQSLVKKVADAHLDEVYDCAGQLPLFEVHTNYQQRTSTAATSQFTSNIGINVEVNPGVMEDQKHQLQSIIASFADSLFLIEGQTDDH